MSNKKMRIALIPAYQPSDSLADFAEELCKKGFRVVIVDDGSGSGYSSVFSKSSAYAELVVNDSHTGHRRAVKAGLKYIDAHFSEEITVTTFDACGRRGLGNALSDTVRICTDMLKFILSSLAGFAVDYAFYFFMSLLTKDLSPAVSVPLSNVSARAVSSVVNYSINKTLVFKNKDSVAKTALQYFILVIFILIGNTLVLSVLVNALGINRFLGKIITEIIFFTVSWLVQRRIIFKSDKHGSCGNSL